MRRRVVVLAAALVACGSGGEAPLTATSESTAVQASSVPPSVASTSAPAVATEPLKEENNPRFHPDLLAIAGSYTSLARADGSWWSPLDCRAPIHPSFVSKAASGEHGRKIYTLFVKDIEGYAALTKKTVLKHDPRPPAEVAKMTQVIVKEAWHPVEQDAPCEERRPSFLAPVTKDGKTYRACGEAGLFIMYKPTTAPEGADEGWVYGTVSSGPQPRVTSAGRVGSCMGCHTKAPHGRLFGMPAD